MRPPPPPIDWEVTADAKYAEQLTMWQAFKDVVRLVIGEKGDNG